MPMVGPIVTVSLEAGSLIVTVPALALSVFSTVKKSLSTAEPA